MKYLSLILLLCSVAHASTITVATFTGNYEQVQSGNRTMLKCEYMFLDKRYWRWFENICEPVIFIDYEKEYMK